MNIDEDQIKSNLRSMSLYLFSCLSDVQMIQLLRTVANCLCGFLSPDMPLREDWELQCFLPLRAYQKYVEPYLYNLDY